MKIIIDGTQKAERQLVYMDDVPVYLAGCDFHILLVLGITFNRCEGMYLDLDYIHQHNTARYIHRLKNNIADRLGKEFKDVTSIIKNVHHENYSRGEIACYRLDVESVEICPMFLEAMKCDDGRIKELFEYLDKNLK